VSLLDDIAEALRTFPRLGRYELYCHTSVYRAIQQVSISPPVPFVEVRALYGADIVIAPELGEGVWEMYSDGKLVGYGRIRE